MTLKPVTRGCVSVTNGPQPHLARPMKAKRDANGKVKCDLLQSPSIMTPPICRRTKDSSRELCSNHWAL